MHQLHVLILALSFRIDLLQVLLLHVSYQLDNPIALHLGTDRPVAKCSWRLRTVCEEHVREAGAGHAKVCAGAILLPLLLDTDAGSSSDVDLDQAADDGIVASGEDYVVKLVFLFVLSADTGEDDLGDRGSLMSTGRTLSWLKISK